MCQKIHVVVDPRTIEEAYKDEICVTCEHKDVCQVELKGTYDPDTRITTLQCAFFSRGPIMEV